MKTRRLLLNLATAGLVLGAAGAATAVPVTTSESSYSSESQGTCLGWYVSSGPTPGWVSLCGHLSQSTSGSYSSSSRSVSATRQVQTCDASGCVDSYNETYGGAATPSEFSMNMETGVASFNITLAGENGETCRVSASATATGQYSVSDPWPTVFARLDPSNPYASVSSSGSSKGVQGFRNGAAVSESDSVSKYRSASGSGSVCDWITPSNGAGAGSMSQYGSSSKSTIVYVNTPYVPSPVPLP